MKNKKGFTLVELLAVIAILAILVILALPNVINLYNRAQKETFLTEVKKIHSEAEKKYISNSINGNTIKTINSEDDSKLDMTGEKLQYCINLNNSGKVTSMKVSNHKWIASLEDGESVEDLTIDDLEDGNLDDYKCTGTSSVPAVYCTYDGDMVQGATYTKGKFTYKYKQEYSYNMTWVNINSNGWGVALTDPSSTDDIDASEVCTYINDVPITSMSVMFGGSQATKIDLSKLNTSNVTNMQWMFAVSNFTSLDLSKFDTSNVVNMEYMFLGMKVNELDLSSFNTKKVEDMKEMFGALKLNKINLSSFDTSNVTNMLGMFDMANIETLDLSNFNTSKVTNMHSMFNEFTTKSLNISSFDTSNVTNMDSMFQLSGIPVIDLSNFDISKVTYMGSMFSGTSATTGYAMNQATADKFNDSSVTDIPSTLKFTVK